MKLSAYKTTQVHWGKSQANICKLLSRHGVQDVRFTLLESQGSIICEFNYLGEIDGHNTTFGVRVQVPIPSGRDAERLKNQAHRALFYYLKSKFEALSFGLVEFVKEFLPYLVIPTKTGTTTVYEAMGAKMKQGLIMKHFDAVPLLGDGK